MMRRSKRNAGALAGWLFADLALMMSFVFLDSNAQGQSGPAGPSPSTTAVVSSTTTVKSGVDPEPLEVVLRSTLRRNPSDFTDEINSMIERKYPESTASTFLVVMIRIGSKGTDRRFATSVSEDIEKLLKASWKKIDPGQTYFDGGDDNSLDYGLVKLKLFPIIQ